MYKEILRKHEVKQTPDFTLKVINYELGSVCRNMIYGERFGTTGYTEDKKLEMADLLTQVGLWIEQNGYEVEELKAIGLERFDHRIAEVKKKMIERMCLERE